MALLKPLTTGGYLKAGFFGFPKSGKTYTAAMLGVGTRHLFGLKGPIAFFDTEGGSSYIKDRIEKATGTNLIGLKSRALKDLIEVGREAESSDVSVLIVDSITHVWRELQESYLERINKLQEERKRSKYSKLEFQHWGPIKRMWSEWTDFYLNSSLHIIICGRAGFEYDFEKDEQSGKKELIKTGTKMQAEKEFGFEPSLLVEMERVQEIGSDVMLHRATVIGDRFGLIDGKSEDNPDAKFFLPHLQKLIPAAHTKIDTQLKSSDKVDHDGNDEAGRRARQRKIYLEEIDGELMKKWPSTGAKDKSARMEVFEKVFGTRSETRLEMMDVDQLKSGLKMVREIIHAEMQQTAQ